MGLTASQLACKIIPDNFMPQPLRDFAMTELLDSGSGAGMTTVLGF